MMQVPFLDVGASYAELARELDDAYSRVMKGGWYILGRELEAFEHEFAEYCGAGHCVGVASGLDAIVIALRAMGVGPGAEVLVPAQTFVATWLAVEHVGAVPIPVESDATCTMDPGGVRAALTERTRAVLPVHLYGIPADTDAIAAALPDPSIRLIEDAAQSHGARLRDRRCGTLGAAAAFSFYPGKNLGAFGDGGAVVTNDAALADEFRRLRNYGSRRKYHHEINGYNSRLDELQAAFLRVKLRHLDEWNARRHRLAERYHRALAETPLKLPLVPEDREAVWHLFPIMHPLRDQLAAHLHERGVETVIHYPVPPHRQPPFLGRGFSCPLAERTSGELLSLPIGPHISDAQAEHVISSIRSWCAEHE